MSGSSFGTVGEAGGKMAVSAVSLGADVDPSEGAGERLGDKEGSEEGCVTSASPFPLDGLGLGTGLG